MEVKEESDPKLEWWHAVAVGVIAKEGGGKVLLIYDCDVKDFGGGRPSRPRDVLRHEPLKELWKFILERSKSGAAEIWVNEHRPSESNKQECVKIACRRLSEWVSYGDENFIGEKDGRVKGEYHQIKGK
jgi:hypothetical protein